MKVSFFRRFNDTSAEVHEIPWITFAQSFLEPSHQFTAKDDCPLYSPTTFVNNVRHGDNADVSHFGVVDVDGGTEEELEQHRETIRHNGWAACIYFTWSNGKNGLLHYRIIVPFSRPVEKGTDWKRHSERWVDLWNCKGLDKNCARNIACQYYGAYMPVGSAAVRRGELFEGVSYDPDTGGIGVDDTRPQKTSDIDTGTPIKYGLDSLRALKRRLSKSHNPKTANMVEPLGQLINGEAVGDPGAHDRYFALRDLAMYLAIGLENPDVHHLASLFGPTLEEMRGLAPFGKEPDVEELISSGLRKKRSETLLGFQCGDGAEVAARVISDLEKQHGRVVSTDGSLWVPGDDQLWHQITLDDVTRMVLRYSQLAVGTKEKLKVNLPLTRAVEKYVLLQKPEPQFFEGAAAGRAFQDQFVRVTDSALVYEDLSIEHRAQFAYDFSVGAAGLKDPGMWLKLLQETYEGDQGKIDLVQEFFGAAVCGIATRYEKALVLHGGGHDGKSTVLTVLEGLFRPEERCSVAPTAWGREQARPLLVGKALNCVHDLSVHTLLSDSEYLKLIVSGQAIDAKVVHRPMYDFRPRAAHAFSANTLPKTRDHTQGYYRRWLIVSHNRRLPEKLAIPEYGSLILREERPAIVLWALKGAARLVARRRYEIPASVLEAAKEYTEEDPIVGWLDEQCVEGGQTFTRVLYGAYKDWCHKTGHAPMNEINFALRLKAKNIPWRRTKNGNQFSLNLREGVLSPYAVPKLN